MVKVNSTFNSLEISQKSETLQMAHWKVSSQIEKFTKNQRYKKDGKT